MMLLTFRTLTLLRRDIPDLNIMSTVPGFNASAIPVLLLMLTVDGY
jgi:hypothetical protein